MDSWVRYSVTVYLGLLLAGTLLEPASAPAPDPPKSVQDHPHDAQAPTSHDVRLRV